MTYWFNEKEVAKVLQGRRMNYLATEILFCSYTYLTEILNGKKGCSRRMAKDIVACVSNDAKIEDFFEVKER
jgi:hypothetical protein